MAPDFDSDMSAVTIDYLKLQTLENNSLKTLSHIPASWTSVYTLYLKLITFIDLKCLKENICCCSCRIEIF